MASAVPRAASFVLAAMLACEGRRPSVDRPVVRRTATSAPAPDASQRPLHRDPAVARQVENLRAFVRLYGYVRWFHPSDEASEVDWTAMAVWGAGTVRDATDADALKAALERVFLPVAPTLRIYREGDAAPDLARLRPADTAGHTTVGWQYLGPGARNQVPPYLAKRSDRTGVHPDESSGEFSSLVRNLGPTAFEGKRLRLRGMARVEGSGEGDRARLWIRVVTPGGPGLYEEMGPRPIRGSGWASHSVTSPVIPEHRTILVGAFLEGVGPAMFDDLELELLEPDGGVRKLPLDNGDFEAGLTGWTTMGFGLEVAATAAAVRTGAQGLQIQRKLVTLARDRSLFPAASVVGDVVDEPIGHGLRVQVPLALHSRDGRTLGRSPAWPDLQAALAADRVRRPDAYDLLAHPDLRAAAVAVAWNVLQHFYPYFDLVAVDWDAALTAALAESVTTADELEFLHALGRMIAPLDDGHAQFIAPAITDRLGALPVRFDWVEGGVTVVASAVPDVQRGDVVDAIDGVPVAAWLADIEARISGSPQRRRATAMAEATLGRRGAATSLELRRGGEPVRARLIHGDTPAPFDPPGPPIHRHADGVFVVDLARADWAAITAELPRLIHAPVVFDIRNYAIDTSVLIAHMVAAPDEQHVHAIARVLRPDHVPPAGWEEGGWELGSKTPKFTGKIAWLIGPGTQSYMEVIVGTAERYRLGELVGAATSGANGNVRRVNVPGDLQLIFTGARVRRHDGGRFHGVGISPTVPQDRTLVGVRDGRDEVLERGLAVVRAQAGTR